jgi:hypothetical protein
MDVDLQPLEDALFIAQNHVRSARFESALRKIAETAPCTDDTPLRFDYRGIAWEEERTCPRCTALQVLRREGVLGTELTDQP